MEGKLVCLKHGRILRAKKNGVVMEQVSSFGPERLYCADIWSCPDTDCGFEIVVTAKMPAIQHHEEGFKEMRDAMDKAGHLLKTTMRQ